MPRHSNPPRPGTISPCYSVVYAIQRSMPLSHVSAGHLEADSRWSHVNKRGLTAHLFGISNVPVLARRSEGEPAMRLKRRNDPSVRAFWSRHVALWMRSPFSLREYCDRNGISRSLLSKWWIWLREDRARQEPIKLERRKVRQEQSRPLVDAIKLWLEQEHERIPRRAHALHRRRPHRVGHQPGRARNQTDRTRTQESSVRWQRRRRRTMGDRDDTDRDVQAQWRLATIPGVGPITASAIAASAPDASLFRSGRQFAAWLGLTPLEHSSGGKDRKLGISKQGDAYLRRLLVVGATAVLRSSRKPSATNSWATRMLTRKRPKIVAVPLANKTARIAWALLSRKESYIARPA